MDAFLIQGSDLCGFLCAVRSHLISLSGGAGAALQMLENVIVSPGTEASFFSPPLSLLCSDLLAPERSVNMLL